MFGGLDVFKELELVTEHGVLPLLTVVMQLCQIDSVWQPVCEVNIVATI